MDNILINLKRVLETTPRRWNDLITSLSPELLNLPPARGEWSALECLEHLIEVEQTFQTRLAAFLAGKDFPAYDPDSQGGKTKAAEPEALADEFARLRSDSLTRLEKISSGDLGRRVRHAELGMVTLEEMLHEWAGHDLMHSVQAERALMQPFIQGCGPWKSYFKDHAVKG